MSTNFELFQLLTEIPVYSFATLIHYVYIIGVETTFYKSNGNIKSLSPFLNGKKHGLYQKWCENGNLKFEFPYVYGEEHGIHKGWYS
jgi:antitoxin component YwqK of YwqJK toxin-antitoxin module